MITSLFKVVLPQVLVTWIPTLVSLLFGFALAFAVSANFDKVSTSIAIAFTMGIGLVVFLMSDVFEKPILKRLTNCETDEAFFHKLREKHKSKLSSRANKIVCIFFHVLFFFVLVLGMFLLDKATSCCSRVISQLQKEPEFYVFNNDKPFGYALIELAAASSNSHVNVPLSG
jgi:hypothetical protein